MCGFNTLRVTIHVVATLQLQSHEACENHTLMCGNHTSLLQCMSFTEKSMKSAVQELVRSYHTWAQRYVQIFAASFLKLCVSVRPVFLVYSPHKYCLGIDESFLNNHSGCRKKLEKHLDLTSKILVLCA